MHRTIELTRRSPLRAGHDVVAISASASSVTAVATVLRGLPRTFSAAILVVLHRTPRGGGLLEKVLARHALLPVESAKDGMRILPGHVYVAPADRHMRVTSEHTVSLFDHTRINFARSSSDPLFDSVAAVYGPRAVGVVLSGMGRNGAAGAKRLHDVGGTVLAQDRATAEYFAMPHAAIELGAVDWVLPIDRVAGALIALTRHPRVANRSA